MMTNNFIKNNKGILTVDYLFAIVLAMGFMAILFALSMTLTMVDVVQYMTFSSARVYSVANVSESRARTYAEQKFNILFNDKRISPILKNKNWFELKDNLIIGGPSQHKYPPSDKEDEFFNHTFHGVSIGFQARMLDIKIPFYGSTNSKGDDEGFITQIHSFLGRESSVEECQSLTDKRLGWLLRYYQSEYLNNSLQNYVSIADNGC